MKMTVEDKGGVKVVYLDGKLDSNTAGQISDDMVKLAQENEKVVVNLGNLEYISSAGLRVILLAAKLIKNHHHGTMNLCEANAMVGEVLEVSGFHHLLHIFNSEEDAIE